MKTAAPELNDTFRDQLSAVNENGKRNWFYPQKPKGLWHNRRVLFTMIMLSMLFDGPFLKYNGQPLLLFNVLERKFIIFGLFIGPQDYWLFGLMMLSFIVFAGLFTTIFGRLWCGWACPQTVFMEMVFRKIEYAIEGDRPKQIALSKAPWTAEKIIKKISKYAAFLAVSFVIANLLLSYIIGINELSRIVHEPLDDHIPLFTGIGFFTAIFYFNFAWLRDQACTIVCPYGRLQSVLLDKNSIVVAYDYVRGEPRGKLRKGQDRAEGDCVSCNQCVAVCPTGIDIRNGTQMECVSCTACIDACDSIMDKVAFQPGLIRYTSEKTIVSKTAKFITGRVIGYIAVLVLLWSALAFTIISRTDTQTTLFRAPGSQYIESRDGTVSNLYTFKIFNKTNHTIHPEIRLLSENGRLLFAGKPDLTMLGTEMTEGTLFITIDQKELTKRKTKIMLGVYQGGQKLEEFETTFMAPEK